ncbi:MAG: hypothetical protein IJP62_05420 [Treponema sp.]|nr:hypothetical protein [Treponema sp.]
MKVDLNKVLVVTLAGIAVVIILGTAVAIFSKKAVPGAGLRKNDPTPEQTAAIFQKQQKSAFTKIGQLRTSTAPDENDNRSVIVITPWLEYAGNDAAFFEELDTKLRSIRASITNYFNNFTKDQLLFRGESLVKADLLFQINESLVLGKVTAIYFNEYQFLD